VAEPGVFSLSPDVLSLINAILAAAAQQVSIPHYKDRRV